MDRKNQFATMGKIVEQLESALKMADNISLNMLAAKISEALEVARQTRELQRGKFDPDSPGVGTTTHLR
jgi:hypothetical protein